jgi:hypothetical protein
MTRARPWGSSDVDPFEFDPEALAAMVEAFDAAYKALDDRAHQK